MKYRIKEFRKARSMTQEELARKSGISRTTISGLENGKKDAPQYINTGKNRICPGCESYRAIFQTSLIH